MRNFMPIFDGQQMTLEEAYNNGYDCEINGATIKNCHYNNFSSTEHLKAWENGKAQAKIDKEGDKWGREKMK
jgi:hypothetical protein